jgi:hypothetical protein
MASSQANTQCYEALVCCAVSAGIHRRLWGGLIADTPAIQDNAPNIATRTLPYPQRKGL